MQCCKTLKKWKCSTSWVFCLICLKFCRLLKVNKWISLDVKFRWYGNLNENNWPLFKHKRLLFSHNKKSVSSIFLQNLILPAVAIKLYCFKLLFEYQFCLNNRPFVFSIIDNNFDSGCHNNKIWNEAKFCLPSSNSLQSFKQIKQKTPEILHFQFFIVLQYCVCDVIFNWKWGWKPTKWRCPSFLNSWLWNGISREPFGALRSVMARFLAFVTLFHLSLTFFSTRGSF